MSVPSDDSAFSLGERLLHKPWVQSFMFYLVVFCAFAPLIIYMNYFFVRFYALFHPELLAFRIYVEREMIKDMAWLPYLGSIGVLFAPTFPRFGMKEKAGLFVLSLFFILAGYTLNHRLGFL